MSIKITPEDEQRHEETVKGLRNDRVEDFTLKFQEDAKLRGGYIGPSNARRQAEFIADKLDVNGVTGKGRTGMERWELLIEEDPSIIFGEKGLSDAEGLDRTLVTAWLRDRHMTAFSRLAATTPMVKLHAIARQHGKRDAFDRTSPYIPIGGVKEGEPVVKNAGHLSREQNDTHYRFFTKQGWNKHEQAQLYKTDRARYERLSTAAEVTLGSTRPKK